MDTPRSSSSRPDNSTATPPRPASGQVIAPSLLDDSPSASASPTPPSAPRLRNADTAAYRLPGAGLYEFRSLLEAAQRIASSASFGPDGGSWLADEQPDPIIRRSRGPDELRRRVPLTRQYSGRPHVPGEDSGSDNGDSEIDSRREGDLFRMEDLSARDHNTEIPASEQNDENSLSAFVSQNLRRMNGNRAYLEASRTRERQQGSRLHSRSPPRLSEQEQEQEQEIREHETLRRAAAITRDLRRHQQRRRLRDEAAALTGDSHQDNSLSSRLGDRDAMTSSPSNNDSPTSRPSQLRYTQDITPSTRTNSVRRWRPAERLQDYASNNARRENDGEMILQNQTNAQSNPLGLNTIVRTRPDGETVTLGQGRLYREPTTGRALTPETQTDAEVNQLDRIVTQRNQSILQPDSSGVSASSTTPQNARAATANELGDHNDIVDRVERALQEYRMARRALRATEENSLRRSYGSQSSIAEAFSSRGLVYRPPYIRSTLPGLDEIDTRPRRRPIGVDGTLDTTTLRPSLGSSSAEARGFASSPSWEERWRSEDSIRDRIREQVRERRRRVVNSILEQERSTTFGTGPLFDGSRRALRLRSDLNGEDERIHVETRRQVDIIRSMKMRANSKHLKQAKASLQYLARLREPEMTSIKAWTLAAELGLHNQSLHGDIEDKLAMSVDDLPKPAFSTWLEAGICWSGMQSADDSNKVAAYERRRAELDLQRSHTEQREEPQPIYRQEDHFGMHDIRARDPLERVLMGNTISDNPSAVTENDIQTLDDAERNLTSMLERSEQLLRENEQQLRRNRERLRETDERLRRLREGEVNLRDILMSKDEYSKSRDDWVVKVTLHSVDWDKMTLTGTMNASQKQRVIPDQPNSEMNSAAPSIDSFFTGEIIDFAKHGLDTPASMQNQSGSTSVELPQSQRTQDQWRAGGPEIDLIHWAGIGPFKQHIDKVIAQREAEVLSLGHGHEDDKMLVGEPSASAAYATIPAGDSTSLAMEEEDEKNEALPLPGHAAADSGRTILTDDDKHDLKHKIMHQLLADTTWLDEHINKQGWILMRWKERCFVSPGAEPNPEPSRPWIPSQTALSTANNLTSSDQISDIPSDAPYLRYAGFYRRRQHERHQQRIYTTNAAERDEINSTANSRQPPENVDENSLNLRTPTWGLSISGFYYVALHRKTGQIEALYYDHGSAPFQRLKMQPSISISMSQQTNAQEKRMQGDTNQHSQAGSGGLRTNFSIVEFR